jgi:hypothetical protein
MTFVGKKERGYQEVELSNRVNSAEDDAVRLVRDSGNDGFGWSGGRMATKEFPVLAIFVVLGVERS